MEEKDQTVVETNDEELEFEDFEEEGEEASEETPKKQSREENHEQAKARREREQKEREEKIRKEAFEEGKRAANLSNNKVNAFTGQAINDDYDLKIYEIQKQIKEDGGDPVNDLPSKIAEIKRNEELNAKKQSEQTTREKERVNKQLVEFKSAYPNLDHKAELSEGSAFREYATGKLGGEKTLKEIYDDFIAFTKKFVDKQGSQKELEQGIAKGSVPSTKTTTPTKSKKTVAEMSDEEFIKYYTEKHGSF